MSEARKACERYPAGEYVSVARDVAREAVKEGTLSGTVHVERDPDAAVTLPVDPAFFTASLKVSGHFEALVGGLLGEPHDPECAGVRRVRNARRLQ